MKKITYGVPRLVDWVAQIKAGAATMMVHFTGGALTIHGVTPAEYTTTDPFIQKVIENSSYFKSGRIIVLRTMEMPDTPITRVSKKTVNSTKQKRDLPEKIMPKEDEVTLKEDNEQMKQGATEYTEEVEKEGLESSGLISVEALCLQDAQAYLQENFNIASYKVRSYEAAQRAAGEHGVRFTGPKFDATHNNSGEEPERVSGSENGDKEE